MTAGRTTTARQSAGDYHGRPTTRLENDHLWLEALSAAGPRIVRLGLSGSAENLLAETPDAGWPTPFGRYELFGGHRLWAAPEDPDLAAAPDSDGLVMSFAGDGMRLEGRPEPTTGLVKSITIRLNPASPEVELHHELTNSGHDTIELAPWSITQLPLGGTAWLPQVPITSDHVVRPNRLVVLWPYSSWEDPRLELRDGGCSVRGIYGPPLKIGTFVVGGSVSYSRAGVTLTSRFNADNGSDYPDLGCNVEVYADERFLELEILGALTKLQAGSSVVLDERWELTP